MNKIINIFLAGLFSVSAQAQTITAVHTSKAVTPEDTYMDATISFDVNGHLFITETSDNVPHIYELGPDEVKFEIDNTPVVQIVVNKAYDYSKGSIYGTKGFSAAPYDLDFTSMLTEDGGSRLRAFVAYEYDKKTSDVGLYSVKYVKAGDPYVISAPYGRYYIPKATKPLQSYKNMLRYLDGDGLTKMQNLQLNYRLHFSPDINRNGYVDTSDVDHLSNLLLGKIIDFNAGCDFDANGVFSIADIVYMIERAKTYDTKIEGDITDQDGQDDVIFEVRKR